MKFIFTIIGTVILGYASAQGIKNSSSTINVTAEYLVCEGGIDNGSGTITNNGTIILNGGSWVNDGTYTTPGSGTVIFNGALPQTIGGTSLTTFNDLIIDPLSAGTTIVAGARITVSGSIFNPNNKLAINSDDVNNNGSLIYTGSGTPSGTVTYNRVMPGSGTIIDWHYVSSPVGPSSPAGSFYGWTETTGLWDVDPINTTTFPLASGRGYTLQTLGNSVSFTGFLRTTDLVVDASSPYKNGYTDRSSEFAYGLNNNDIWAPDRSWTNYGGGGFNLLGNPYTSSINVSGFIAGNPGQFDPNYVAVYLYDGNGYFFIGSPIDGWIDDSPESRSETHIQAGQGFFVLALNDGSTFTFTRDMQEHDADVSLLKSGNTGNVWPGLRLKAKYGDNESSTLVVYNEQMTPGLDPGYDVGQMSTGPDVEIYTSLVEKDNSVNFAQQALPMTDFDKNTIPVGVDSEKGGEVTFSAFTVPLSNNKFWLEDRKTGIFTDLNLKSYTVTIPAKTYGTGRFFIYASVNTPTGIDDLSRDLDVRIWTSQDKLIIKGSVSQGARVTVFDLQGNKVLENLLPDEAQNTVSMPTGSHGVFLVKVVDGVKVYTQKVVML